MSPTGIPARITIDFRDAVQPSRLWIVGVGDTAPGRVDLLGFETSFPPSLATTSSGPLPTARPTAMAADCACPDFCERDHANE